MDKKGVKLSVALTWVDPKTGLEWQRNSPGKMTWDKAMEYAKTLSIGGTMDWRLPNVKEFETLLDRTRYRPEMRSDIPFRDTLSYWTRTTFEEGTNSAWIMIFDGAYILSYYKRNMYHVHCVRGKWTKGN